MADENQADQLLGDDKMRLVDVLLEEVCSAPGAVAHRSERRPHRDQWLVAALVLLGIGVAFGVAVLSRPATIPAQDPRPDPMPIPPNRVPPNQVQEVLGTLVELGDAPSRTHELDRLAIWRPDQAGRASAPVGPRLPEMPDTGHSRVTIIAEDPAAAPRSINEPPPAVALMRDLLPANAYQTGVLRAELGDTAQLAEQPAHLLSLRCDGGDSYLLAQALPRFTNLRRLQLGQLFDDHVANVLANANQLEELEVGCQGLTDAGLLRLARLSRLRTLVLWGDLSTLTGKSLGALPRLQCLRVAAPIDTTRRSPAGLDLLQQMLALPQLHELQLVLTEPPPDAADGRSALSAPLAAMPALRRLSVVLLSGSHSSLVRGLSSLHLDRLQIHGDQLTEADVAALGELNTLVELHLGDARFAAPAAAVASLGRLSRLRRLVLGFTDLPDRDCTTLLRALPDCVVYTDGFSVKPDGSRQNLRSGRTARAVAQSRR